MTSNATFLALQTIVIHLNATMEVLAFVAIVTVNRTMLVNTAKW